LLSWFELFGNANPLELEVGFGKGLFLVNSALKHPKRNFVGVDIDRGLQLYVANRIAKRGLRNVKLAQGDARNFLRDQTPDASLQAIHVYFPDPWWKARHKKRRVFTADFARECQRCLKPGGRLQLATDVEEYFRVMKEVIATATTLEETEPTPRPAPEHDMDFQTNFERKAIQRGCPVWRASYVKQHKEL
jgi:tRNA (guanine-N7-)-methyltransferase